jgi:hypothetical protein
MSATARIRQRRYGRDAAARDPRSPRERLRDAETIELRGPGWASEPLAT